MTNKNKFDLLASEYQQIRVRIILDVVGLILVCMGIYTESADIAWLLPFMLAHLVFNAASLIHSRYYPRHDLRRYLSIVSDTAIVTLATYATGGVHSGVSLVYLIILLGNGIRYGMTFLRFATITVMAGQSVLLYLSLRVENAHWTYEAFNFTAFVIVTLYIWSILKTLTAYNEELHASWEKTKSLISKLPGVVCYFTSEGKVCFASEQARSVLGVNPEDLVSAKQTWDALINYEKGQAALPLQRRGTFRYRIKRPDNGAIRWIEDRRDSFFDENGQEGIVSIAQDVTAELESHSRLLNLSRHKVVHTQVLQSLLQERRLEETLEDCSHLIGQTFNAHGVVVVWRHDKSGKQIELHSWFADPAHHRSSYVLNPKMAVWNKILALGNIKVWENLDAAHPLWGKFQAKYGTDRVLALSIPMGNQGCCAIALLGNCSKPAWSHEDYSMIRTLLSSVAHGVERSLLRQQANTDPLTGMLNRRAIEQELANALEISRMDGSPISVAVCDIDFFKVINDTHGHDAGDEVLRIFSERLGQNVRRSDRISRMGGEEFLIMFPGLSLVEATESAERLRQRTEEKGIFLESGHEVRFTASIGVAQWREEEDLQDLLQRADQLLYAAKRAGRNQVLAVLP